MTALPSPTLLSMMISLERRFFYYSFFVKLSEIRGILVPKMALRNILLAKAGRSRQRRDLRRCDHLDPHNAKSLQKYS